MYSLNYSDMACSLWFCCKDEAANLNANIANTNPFKSFNYKSKLLGNTDEDGNNSLLENATVTVPLKYLSNFW